MQRRREELSDDHHHPFDHRSPDKKRVRGYEDPLGMGKKLMTQADDPGLNRNWSEQQLIEYCNQQEAKTKKRRQAAEEQAREYQRKYREATGQLPPFAQTKNMVKNLKRKL